MNYAKLCFITLCQIIFYAFIAVPFYFINIYVGIIISGVFFVIWICGACCPGEERGSNQTTTQSSYYLPRTQPLKQTSVISMKYNPESRQLPSFLSSTQKSTQKSRAAAFKTNNDQVKSGGKIIEPQISSSSQNQEIGQITTISGGLELPPPTYSELFG